MQLVLIVTACAVVLFAIFRLASWAVRQAHGRELEEEDDAGDGGGKLKIEN